MARTPGRKIRKRWFALGAVALVAIAVVAFFVFRPESGQPTTRTQDVTVTKSTEQITVSMTGTLASARQAELSFGASGTVTSVPATVGKAVSQGTVLATIDDSVLQDNVALASAQLTAARANLTQVSGTSGATSAAIASARAQVNSAQAKLSSAQTNLASATITAPFDGVVAAVNVSVGNTASGQAAAASGIGAATGMASSASQSAIVLIDPHAWIVNGNVGAADVGALKADQSATLRVQGTTVTAPAAVRTVGIVASTTSGTTAFPVTLRVEGNPAGLYYGASVDVSVNAGTYADILTIPTNAITTTGTTTTVQKLVDGAPVATPVTLGKVFGDRTQVIAGLAEGDLLRVTLRTNPQRSAGGFGGFGGPGGSGRPGAPPTGGGTHP